MEAPRHWKVGGLLLVCCCYILYNSNKEGMCAERSRLGGHPGC
jgi:hypothetical protein